MFMLPSSPAFPPTPRRGTFGWDLYSAPPDQGIDPGADRFEVTTMPVTRVHTTPDAHSERVLIDNADVGNLHEHVTGPLTDGQLRDAFKSRGVSEQEIEDLVARARRPTDRS
jgi:hypothetical protein